jgi:gluconate 2-dehydrogenase alpha chain
VRLSFCHGDEASDFGSSTFPSMSGHNPTLTIQALGYVTADAIVNRYVRAPGPLV